MPLGPHGLTLLPAACCLLPATCHHAVAQEDTTLAVLNRQTFRAVNEQYARARSSQLDALISKVCGPRHGRP